MTETLWLLQELQFLMNLLHTGTWERKKIPSLPRTLKCKPMQTELQLRVEHLCSIPRLWTPCPAQRWRKSMPATCTLWLCCEYTGCRCVSVYTANAFRHTKHIHICKECPFLLSVCFSLSLFYLKRNPINTDTKYTSPPVVTVGEDM